MITVTVQNDNIYTEINFPCTDTYLNSKLMEIKTGNIDNTTFLINEVISPKELSFLEEHYINLDELNYLAKRMDSFFGDEETQFFEAIKLENFVKLKDLINLTFNIGKYTIIKDVSDMTKVGREYLLNTRGCIPADDEDDPKYAKIGRELLQSGRVIFTENGLLFADYNREFEELYNGKTFPLYLYDECLLVGEIEYGEEREFVYLPSEEISIEKAVKRLGADSLDNCLVNISNVNVKNDKIYNMLETILKNDGIYN